MTEQADARVSLRHGMSTLTVMIERPWFRQYERNTPPYVSVELDLPTAETLLSDMQRRVDAIRGTLATT